VTPATRVVMHRAALPELARKALLFQLHRHRVLGY
jgi:hypothetical protein